MALTHIYPYPYDGIQVGRYASASPAGHSLNSAYVFKTSGNCLILMFDAPCDGPLNELLVFVNAIGGTGGSNGCDLCSASSATAVNAVLTSATPIVDNGANHWIALTFPTPYTLVGGRTYGLVFYGTDADPATNYSSILRGGPLADIANTPNYAFRCRTSTDGANTSSLASAIMPIVLKIGSNVIGNTYTKVGTYASNTRERGIKLANAVVPLSTRFIEWKVDAIAPNGAKVYASDTAPGGTPLGSITWDSGNLNGHRPMPDVNMAGDGTYRIVLVPSVNTTGPSYFEIEDYTFDAALLACSFWGGRAYGTIDDGAGGWTDEVNKFPIMSIRCDPYTPEGGSSTVIVIED